MQPCSAKVDLDPLCLSTKRNGVRRWIMQCAVPEYPDPDKDKCCEYHSNDSFKHRNRVTEVASYLSTYVSSAVAGYVEYHVRVNYSQIRSRADLRNGQLVRILDVKCRILSSNMALTRMYPSTGPVEQTVSESLESITIGSGQASCCVLLDAAKWFVKRRNKKTQGLSKSCSTLCRVFLSLVNRVKSLAV
jgi:hypothetical protein